MLTSVIAFSITFVAGWVPASTTANAKQLEPPFGVNIIPARTDGEEEVEKVQLDRTGDTCSTPQAAKGHG